MAKNSIIQWMKQVKIMFLIIMEKAPYINIHNTTHNFSHTFFLKKHERVIRLMVITENLIGEQMGFCKV